MKKLQRYANRTEDREKLEETVKAAEDMIALLTQFGVPIKKNTVRAVKRARKYLNESKPTRTKHQPGTRDRN
jgi:hypothetical protein